MNSDLRLFGKSLGLVLAAAFGASAWLAFTLWLWREFIRWGCRS